MCPPLDSVFKSTVVIIIIIMVMIISNFDLFITIHYKASNQQNVKAIQKAGGKNGVSIIGILVVYLVRHDVAPRGKELRLLLIYYDYTLHITIT